MGAYIWEGGMLGGMVICTTRIDSTQNIGYGQKMTSPVCLYLAMEWIPKDAGCIFSILLFRDAGYVSEVS